MYSKIKDMILNTSIKDNKHTIWFEVDSKLHDIRYVYLDTYSNSKNYLSHVDDSHNYKFLKDEIYLISSLYRSEYEINVSKLDINKITGLFILTIVYDDGVIEHKIIYDLNELYCLRVDLLTKTCINCDDKANFKKLTVLMFREMLLKNAINLNYIEDSLKYYKDIFRLSCNNKNNNCISCCTTGLCNI